MLEKITRFFTKHTYRCAMTLVIVPFSLLFIAPLMYLPFMQSIRYQGIIIIMNMYLVHLLVSLIVGAIAFLQPPFRRYRRAASISILATCVCAIFTNTIGATMYARDMTERVNQVADYQVKINNTVYYTEVKDFFIETRKDKTPYLIADIVPVNDHVAEIKWSGYRDLDLYDDILDIDGIDYDAMGVCPGN